MIDLTGKVFGNWQVLYRNGSKNNFAVWHCQCNLCKREYDIVSQSLVTGKSTQCRSCSTSKIKTKAFSKDPIKSIFTGMYQRCYNKNNRHFMDYGARGITICEEWLNNRENFYYWAYLNGYKKGLSIERIDVNKGYLPTNCCFIKKNEQNFNKRNSIMVTIHGKTQCLSLWCKELDLSRNKIRRLVESKKISYEQAIKRFIDN